MKRMLSVLGPGLLVAATGVGAGDLATASFAGMHLGTAVLWAVLLGAFLKFVLTEGLARWQLATGQTILEGAVTRLGRAASVVFALYLVPWTFFVGAALISACGVTGHAIVAPLGLFESPAAAKLVVGAAHAALGVALVWTGGYALIERLMAGLVAVMFASVVLTAILLRPDLREIVSGLTLPRIPRIDEGGLTWTIALLGGVGGTLTVICYGYWIREEGRDRAAHLRACRIDLGVGYAATARFGIAMIVIARDMVVDGRGAGLIVALAEKLDARLGAAGRWLFLVGAWAAVFSSLLGVWQSVPYVYADFVRLQRRQRGAVDVRSPTYRAALLALAIVPLLQVQHPFRDVQRWYAIIGAVFIPLLAVTLLALNRPALVGPRLGNRPWTIAVLIATILVFLIAGVHEVRSKW